jgi:hypothetical protein
MQRTYDPNSKYVENGRRTPQASSLGNLLLGHFDKFTGKTFDQVANEVIASDWKPPKSQLYKTPAEKKKFLGGYFTHLVSEGYLREVIE